MSRYPRSSADDLAYGDIPQRWDRDRFERLSRGPPGRYEEDFKYTERDRPGRRDITVTDRIEERGSAPRYDERDRYVEVERIVPARVRRRTDKELFGDVDPRELADMSLTPYRRKSVSRQDFDIDRRPSGPPRPGMLRRQSSLNTFDRQPIRYEREEYRVPAYAPVPLPYRRRREDDFEDIRYRETYAPEDYREVEITRERSVHRHRPRSVAESKAKSSKAKSSKAPSHVTSSSSSSSSDTETFEEVEKEESIRESIVDTRRKFKKGKTRMPKRLVRREAIMDLGYPFDEEDDFYVLRIALEKEQIDEVIEISKTYNNGEKTEKKVYRFEETEGPAKEREEVLRTEWYNPPTVVMAGARSVRAPSPSSKSTTTRRTSPARTRKSSRPRRNSSPSTIIEERKTVIEERRRSPSPRSNRGALVVQERESRSDRDIQSEIRALEAEQRALRLEREAEKRRDRDYQLVEYDRPRREVLEVVEREHSPPRNVVRVEKDRKGRMALVRSAH